MRLKVERPEAIIFVLSAKLALTGHTSSDNKKEIQLARAKVVSREDNDKFSYLRDDTRRLAISHNPPLPFDCSILSGMPGKLCVRNSYAEPGASWQSTAAAKNIIPRRALVRIWRRMRQRVSHIVLLSWNIKLLPRLESTKEMDFSYRKKTTFLKG